MDYLNAQLEPIEIIFPAKHHEMNSSIRKRDYLATRRSDIALSPFVSYKFNISYIKLIEDLLEHIDFFLVTDVWEIS